MLPNSIACVHFAAVVSGTEVNLALNKPAYQSSEAAFAAATRAVGTSHMGLII